MTNEAFQALLARGPVLLDGATGSNLMRAGMPRGICTEVWVTEHPEPLLALQRDYIAAGSQIIYAPTFCANRRGLARCGRENDVALLNRQLVALSLEAADGHALVAGDLTTTGVPLEPAGTMTYHELFEIYTEQIAALAEAGADLLVVETMLGIDEMTVALEAAQSVCALPVLCSMTVQADGSGYFGGTCGRRRHQLLHRPGPAREPCAQHEAGCKGAAPCQAECGYAGDLAGGRGHLFHGPGGIRAAYAHADRCRSCTRRRLLRHGSALYFRPAGRFAQIMLRLLRRRCAVRDGRNDLAQLLFPHVACGKNARQAGPCRLVCTGTIPPNPSELLSSDRMKSFVESCTDYYDYVIIDTPPINTVADAQIISTFVDGVVLVARSGNTTADELNAATAAVRRAGGNLCGVVLNGLNMKSVKYASKYKYGDKYGYRYSYSESYGAK